MKFNARFWRDDMGRVMRLAYKKNLHIYHIRKQLSKAIDMIIEANYRKIMGPYYTSHLRGRLGYLYDSVKNIYEIG